MWWGEKAAEGDTQTLILWSFTLSVVVLPCACSGFRRHIFVAGVRQLRGARSKMGFVNFGRLQNLASGFQLNLISYLLQRLFCSSFFQPIRIQRQFTADTFLFSIQASAAIRFSLIALFSLSLLVCIFFLRYVPSFPQSCIRPANLARKQLTIKTIDRSF